MGQKLPKFLDAWEREALLAIPNPRYWTGERNKLLIRLMLKTGLRLSEAVNLQWQHMNMLTGRLMVREGKGAKDRRLWVDERTLQMCKDWRERQTERTGRQAYIFTTFHGTPIQGRYVQEMLERYSRKANLKHIHPHMLRHTFATEYLDSGGNIRKLQVLLGHSNLSTTEIYTHVSDAGIEEELKSIQSTW